MNFENFFQKIAKELLFDPNDFDTVVEADICTGSFNLAGWDLIKNFLTLDWFKGGTCRLLVGKQYKTDYKELYESITWGLLPVNREKVLSVLREALEQRRLIIKYDTKNQIHAKIYLFRRSNLSSSKHISYTGSSNLTKTGLTSDGEFNLRVSNHSEAQELVTRFEGYWNRSSCVDCSKGLQALAAAELFGLEKFSFKNDDEWLEIPAEVYNFAHNILTNMDEYLFGSSDLVLDAEIKNYAENWKALPKVMVPVVDYPYWQEIERLIAEDEKIFHKLGAKDYLIESEYIEEAVKDIIYAMNGTSIGEASFNYNVHRMVAADDS